MTGQINDLSTTSVTKEVTARNISQKRKEMRWEGILIFRDNLQTS